MAGFRRARRPVSGDAPPAAGVDDYVVKFTVGPHERVPMALGDGIADLDEAEATFKEWLADVDEAGWKRVNLRDGSWSRLVFRPEWVTSFEVGRGRLPWVADPPDE